MALKFQIPTNNDRRLSQQGTRPAASEKLSSGLKLRQSGDDAASLAIAQKMRADLNGLSRSVNGHNELLSVLQATDEALMLVGEALNEMKRLAELCRVEPAGTEETATRIARYEELKSEIDRIVGSQYYGMQLFCSGNAAKEESQISIQFGSGSEAEDDCSIDVVDSTAKGLGIANSDIAAPDKAYEAHQAILAAIIKVDEARSYFGSVQAKLQ